MATRECRICLSVCDSSIFLETCPSHSFCEDCILGFLQLGLRNFSAKLRCPGEGCKLEVSNDFLRRALTNPKVSVLRRWVNRAIRWRLVDSGSHVECPAKNCGALSRRPWLRRFAKCGRCGKEFCKECRRSSHEFGVCLASREDNFQQLRASFKLRNCPHCSTPIERTEGCDHMHCRQCLTHFCWLCGDRIYINHYSSLNPLGCSSSHNLNLPYLYLLRSLKCFLFLLLSILMVKLLSFAWMYAGLLRYAPGILLLVGLALVFRWWAFVHLYWAIPLFNLCFENSLVVSFALFFVLPSVICIRAISNCCRKRRNRTHTHSTPTLVATIRL